MRKLLLSSIASLAALLAGCAGNPFAGPEMAPGTPRDVVIARMGAPSRVVRVPGGNERLQYSQQPFGRVAWMVDLDPGGRVVQARQALTDANFRRIEPGKWTRDDIEREFGPPALVDRVSSWNGPIMTYRWRDIANADMFYWVYLDPANVVRRAHPGLDLPTFPDERR